jgi:GNAT superfamily N-acetyltransferase
VSFTEEVWQSRLRPDGNPNFVAERADGQAVGLATGIRAADASSPAHLVSMWVAPEARGSGVADRLVAEVIEWARTDGVSALQLRVTEGNARAERLYERHGFERTGTTFVRERDGLTEVEMDLRVGEPPNWPGS